MLKRAGHVTVLASLILFSAAAMFDVRSSGTAADSINAIINSLSPDSEPAEAPQKKKSGNDDDARQPIWVSLRQSSPPIRVLVDYRRSLAMRLLFEKNSPRLTSSARQNLQVLAQALQSSALSKARYLLSGHTDSSGSATYNQRLSEKRARSVRRYLVKTLNVEPERLHAVGMGETRFDGKPVTKGPEHRVVRIGLIVEISLDR